MLSRSRTHRPWATIAQRRQSAHSPRQPLARPPRRLATLCPAVPPGGPSGSTPFNLPLPVVQAARAPWFTVGVQGAVFLVVAAAVDAAYSGDWSRIGAITPATEAALKPLVNALFGFHAVCAVVAARAAAAKGRNPAAAAAKAAAVGFLAAVEAVLAEDAA